MLQSLKPFFLRCFQPSLAIKKQAVLAAVRARAVIAASVIPLFRSRVLFFSCARHGLVYRIFKGSASIFLSFLFQVGEADNGLGKRQALLFLRKLDGEEDFVHG
jgi:hypothetical protein